MSKKPSISLLILLVSLGAAILVSGTAGKLLSKLQIRKNQEIVKNEASKKPEKPKLQIPEGKQIYRISMAADSPQFYEAIIDPVKVRVGDKQIMTVKVRDKQAPIKSVVAEVKTDLGIRKYNLKLIEGTKDDGAWEESWIVQDTHDETYRTTFVATNEKGKTKSVTLTWTDPCSPPAGGNWTLAGACSTGANVTTGADNGGIILNGYTLTIDSGATIAFATSSSVTIGVGSVIINSTGQLKQTNLWMTDSDSDGYPANTTQVAQDTSPGASYRRRNVLTSLTTTDVDDSNSSCHENFSFYGDRDSDGYYRTHWVCAANSSSPPSGYYVSNPNPPEDCQDEFGPSPYNDYYPGAGWYLTGTLGWDHNCDNVVTRNLGTNIGAQSTVCYTTSTFPSNPAGWDSTVPGCGGSASWVGCNYYSSSNCSTGALGNSDLCTTASGANSGYVRAYLALLSEFCK